MLIKKEISLNLDGASFQSQYSSILVGFGSLVSRSPAKNAIVMVIRHAIKNCFPSKIWRKIQHISAVNQVMIITVTIARLYANVIRNKNFNEEVCLFLCLDGLNKRNNLNGRLNYES